MERTGARGVLREILSLPLKDLVEYDWVRGEGEARRGFRDEWGKSSQEVGGTGSAECGGPAQRHREEELRAESLLDRGLGRKACLPIPKFLTRNTGAGPYGLGTMCFPWATTLLVIHACWNATG